MPRNMSFALTTDAIRNHTKTVTRRLGWANLKPGDLFWAVEKVRGLKNGEKVRRLALLRCVSNKAVKLKGSTLDLSDVQREGFPGMTPRRMLGNSVAVPCVEWIMRRLQTGARR